MWRRVVAGAVLAGNVAACANATFETSRTLPQQDPRRIVNAEIVAAGATDAYEAVSRLRPLFLARRGETSILLRDQTALTVYLDEVRLGGLEMLRTVPTVVIRSIRFVDASEATLKWGPGHSGGAIQVSMLQ